MRARREPRHGGDQIAAKGGEGLGSKCADDRVVEVPVDKHNELAESLFVDGHHALPRGDRFSDPFASDRWRVRRQLDAHLPLAGDGMGLLDLGCGTGEELGMCQERGDASAALEPSSGMRRLTAERHREVGAHIVGGPSTACRLAMTSLARGPHRGRALSRQSLAPSAAIGLIRGTQRHNDRARACTSADQAGPGTDPSEVALQQRVASRLEQMGVPRWGCGKG